MRRLLIVATVLVTGLTWARNYQEVDERHHHQERFPMEPRNTGGGASGGTRWNLGSPERDRMGQQEEALREQGRVPLRSENAYSVTGRLQSVEPDQHRVVISREALPPIALYVVDGSLITRNNESIPIASLQPGDEVRANFNLALEYPIAIDLELE